MRARFRLANLILRIGPEILTILKLILFNKEERKPILWRESGLQERILDLQRRRSERKDSFISYLDTVSLLRSDGPKRIAVRIKSLEMFVVPFETETRTEIREEKES